jgi:hypothetical protein
MTFSKTTGVEDLLESKTFWGRRPLESKTVEVEDHWSRRPSKTKTTAIMALMGKKEILGSLQMLKATVD